MEPVQADERLRDRARRLYTEGSRRLGSGVSRTKFQISMYQQ